MFYVGFAQFHDDYWRVRYFPDLLSAENWVARLLRNNPDFIWGKVAKYNLHAIEVDCIVYERR